MDSSRYKSNRRNYVESACSDSPTLMRSQALFFKLSFSFLKLIKAETRGLYGGVRDGSGRVHRWVGGPRLGGSVACFIRKLSVREGEGSRSHGDEVLYHHHSPKTIITASFLGP